MNGVAETFPTDTEVLPFEGVRIGPDRPVFLPPNVLNEVAQVRQSYDPVALRELADSMVRDSLAGRKPSEVSAQELTKGLVLLNPLVVARFTSFERADAYLRAHADHYQLDIPRATESLQQAEDGSYYLLIAGHRRKRAIGLIQEDFGIADSELRIATHVFEDVEFEEALGLQLRENVYERPPVHEEAKSIERYYEYINRKENRRLSVRTLATRLGMSETKVGDALAFAALPSEVQAYTPDVLSYTIVRRLKPLYDLFRRQHTMKTELGSPPTEDVDMYAKENVLRLANKLATGKLTGEKKLNDFFNEWRKTLEGELALQTAELFWLEEDSPTHRRARSDLMLGETALAALKLLLETGRLTPTQQEAIQNLAGLSIANTPSHEDTSAPMFAVAN